MKRVLGRYERSRRPGGRERAGRIKRFIVLAGIILLAGIGIWFASQVNTVYATHEYLITKYYRFEVLGEMEVVQEFMPTYEKLESVELFIANLPEKAKGNIWLSIVDENNDEIYKKKFKASSIPTGEFFEYRINRKVDTNMQYRLCVSYDGEVAEPVQIMVSERDKNLVETQTMYVDGLEIEYNMAITYHYSEKVW